MKQKCSTCKLEKLYSEFSKNKTKKTGINTICKECRKVYIRKHYKANKSYYLDKAAQQKQDAKKYWHEFKSKLKCNRCGYNKHWAALDFHHTDGDKKDFGISFAVANGWGRQRILDEIDKCEVLCANCHRIEHCDN